MLVATALLRNAWVCDDSFITLRTVDNLLHGYGLTWNPYERVQTFTHPLWLAVLTVTDLVTSSGYWAVLLPGLLFSLAAVILALGRQRKAAAPVLAVGVLLALSRAFIDYGTSGLENPLAYFLCALAIRVDFATAAEDERKRLFGLSLLAALLALTRMDLILLVAPALAARAIPRLRSHWRPLLVSAMPFVAWEVFAVVYYGFPFPNTAYAKLNAGVPVGDLLRQGLWYLEATVRSDPLTAVVIMAGLGWVLTRRDRQRRLWALGVALYLAYVVRIGGDFMVGRYLAVPFFVVVLLVGDMIPAGRRRWVLVVAAAVGLLVPRNPLLPVAGGADVPWFHGVSDERAFYAPQTGLWAQLRSDFREHKFVIAGREARRIAEQRGGATDVAGSIGFYGYYAGPHLRIIDVMALADPFLARLPISRADEQSSWRIGHFKRDLPAGYTETVSSTVNRIQDPRLAALYRELRLVTTGPLFSQARWRAIVLLNFAPGRVGR